MKIVLVSTRFPLPPYRGQQVRSLEWLQALAGHELRLLCPEPEDENLVSRLLGHIGPRIRVRTWKNRSLVHARHVVRSFFRGRPLQEALYTDPVAGAMLRTMLDTEDIDLVIVQMVRCGWAAEIVGEVCQGLPIIFDAIDSMGLHFAHRGRRKGLKSALFRMEAARCAGRESEISRISSHITAVSQRDLDQLGVPKDKGRVIPVSARIPEHPRKEEEPPFLLLSGNLGYRPTVEGALWFSREVWPEVARRLPGMRWVLAGARPAPAIRRLSRIRGIEVVAEPPDLGDFLARAHLAVVPVATGSGVPMKILEAWAAGVPVVTHPWVLSGIDESCRHAAETADSSREWIEIIVRLHGDADLRARSSRAGKNAWRSVYHPEVVAESIRNFVEEAYDDAGR